MNRCEVHVGRLVEFRAESGYRSIAEVDEVFARYAREIKKIPDGESIVVVTDWRRCPLMSTDAAEHLLARITRTNPRVLRSAAVASRNSPVALLQFLRVVRESKNAERRLFDDPEELVAWLGDVLTPAELTRLREFLAG